MTSENTMRIISREERRKAMTPPLQKSVGLLKRLSLRKPEDREAAVAEYAARCARERYADAEIVARVVALIYGQISFDLATIQRVLRLDAIRAEAEAYYRLFPKERTARMPSEALAQCLRHDLPELEECILIQRLQRARSAEITIEFVPPHAGGEGQQPMNPVLLTMFFDTDNLLECWKS